MGEITRYRPDWSQDSTMRIIAYLAPDAQGDAVTYADHLADREQLQITLKGWLKENAPGGWIDDLRKENAALKAQLADEELAFNHANETIGKLEADLQEARKVALEEAARIADKIGEQASE